MKKIFVIAAAFGLSLSVFAQEAPFRETKAWAGRTYAEKHETYTPSFSVDGKEGKQI